MIIVIFAIVGIAIALKFLPSLILLSKFAYPNAKFSAIPISFLKEKELARLLESKNLEDFKNNVISKDFIIEGENIKEMQKSIDKSLAKIILMAKNDSPKKVKDFYDAYLKKIDADALKNAIKNAIENQEIEQYAFSDEIKKIIRELKKAEKEEIEAILKKYGYNISLDMKFEEIEREIDKKIIKDLMEVPLPSSCNKAREKFIEVFIDILNLKTLLRGKYYNLKNIERSIIEGGWEITEWQIKELLKIDSIPEIVSLLEGTSYMPYLRQAITDFEKEGVIALEKALDKYLIDAVGDIANENPLSIGPGIRFIVEKEFEARNLKAIVKAIGEEMREEAWKVIVTQ